MNTKELTDIINQLIASKSEATPQAVAAALAVHPQVIKDIASLEALKRVERFDQISLSNVSQCGSVRFHSFRADWSCQSSGYGYRDTITDFRKGFSSSCGSAEGECLEIIVQH